jgi:hypothetical protein
MVQSACCDTLETERGFTVADEVRQGRLHVKNLALAWSKEAQSL